MTQGCFYSGEPHANQDSCMVIIKKMLGSVGIPCLEWGASDAEQ